MDGQLVSVSPETLFKKCKPTSTQDITFDTFARGYLQATPPVTYLFRYENQSRLREFLEHRLETEILIPRPNTSLQKPLHLYASVEQEVIEIYQADFDLWHSVG